MVHNAYYQQNSAAFDFSMRTSSGDTIDLSAFKESEVSFQNTKHEGLEVTSLSLRESFGYSFSYEGNGLDKQDIKEIKEALKEIKPLLNFLNPNEDFPLSDKNISDKAMDINNLLPKFDDLNTQNYMKDTLVDMMDEMMQAFKANDEVLQRAREVFDTLQKQMDGLMLYA